MSDFLENKWILGRACGTFAYPALGPKNSAPRTSPIKNASGLQSAEHKILCARNKALWMTNLKQI